MKKQRILKISVVLAVTFLFLVSNINWSLAEDVLKGDEQRMLDLINQERATRNLKPLTVDPAVTIVARNHSEEMIRLEYFSHESPVSGGLELRIKNGNIKNWKFLGENLAGAQSVEIAHSALMNSEKHKENILNPEYIHIGIGVVDGGRYGKMFTQNFIKYIIEENKPASSQSGLIGPNKKEENNNLVVRKAKPHVLAKRRIKRF
ncbi:MAG: hypothetical protein HY776_03500 [Actinobacteria bacterium]|nr:hypothetical protein [Actinomycetota bacterium]